MKEKRLGSIQEISKILYKHAEHSTLYQAFQLFKTAR